MKLQMIVMSCIVKKVTEGLMLATAMVSEIHYFLVGGGGKGQYLSSVLLVSVRGLEGNNLRETQILIS